MCQCNTLNLLNAITSYSVITVIIVNDHCHVCYYNVLLCAVVAPPVGYNVLRCRQEWNGTEIVAYPILYMLQCNTKTTLYTHRQTETDSYTHAHKHR